MTLLFCHPNISICPSFCCTLGLRDFTNRNSSLLQGIFPTQGSNPSLPHCRKILYKQTHYGSPRILEWVAFPFSRASSQLRDQTLVSHIAGRFFISWATREAQEYWSEQPIPYPGHLSDPGIELGSPALQAYSLPAGETLFYLSSLYYTYSGYK